MQPIFDVVIVGAGPAGSTAAILLARAGWSVALIEKQTFPRRKVCGECIAASNLPLLDALGLGDRLDACAGPELRRVAFMQGKDTITADLPAFRHVKRAWGRALGRETLDTLLVAQARAAGAVVLQPWSVRAVAGSAGNFSCAIRAVDSGDTAALQATMIISAQGSWEAPPWNRTEQRSKLRRGDLLAFKGNFSGAALDEGLLPVISFDGGYGGMVLADHRVLTIACCIRADRLHSLRRVAPGSSAGEVVCAMLQRECSGVAAVLQNARRESPWLAAGPLNPGVHLNSHDEVFRIGNAAGEAHPIIGEGMSMAMQSAWLLCGHLLSAAAPQGRLSCAATQRDIRDAYATDWRRFFTRRLRLAALFAYIAMRPRVFGRPLSAMGHFSPLLKYAAEFSGKVTSVLDPAMVAWLASGAAANARAPSGKFPAPQLLNKLYPRGFDHGHLRSPE